jgi:hypothetical protein
MMLSNFVFYCLLYFVSGLIFTLYLVMQAYIRKNIDFYFENIFRNILIYSLFVLLWPIIFIMILYSLYDNFRFSKNSVSLEKYKLQHTDLKERITRCEVELRELVFDPLNAAPSIPFGFLNSVWLEFCRSLEAQDELWTFDLIWESPWGAKIRYAGYAAVRNNAIINILYTC